MKDRFLDPTPVLQQLKNFLSNHEYFEQLSQCFLGCLLLTSEVIFDPKTMWFLELIGWASDESFEILLRAHPAFSSFSIEETYLGFAKHITYFHQLIEHLNNNTFPIAGNSDRLSFYSIVMTIVNARQLLNRERARTRCFRLGGDIAALLYQPFPEWQEVRKSIFMDIARASGGPFDIAQYWAVFERTTEATRRAIREAIPQHAYHTSQARRVGAQGVVPFFRPYRYPVNAQKKCQRPYLPISSACARMWPFIALSTAALVAPALRLSFASSA